MDAWNRLVSVTTPGSSDTITYSYDASGRRITETDGDTGITIDLYFSSSNQVLEEQSSGVTTAQYVWGISYVNQLVEADQYSGDSSTRLYVEQDAYYNVTSLTDSSGAVVERVPIRPPTATFRY